MTETKTQTLMVTITIEPNNPMLLELAEEWGEEVRRDWRGQPDYAWLVYRLARIAWNERSPKTCKTPSQSDLSYARWLELL